MKIFSCVLAFVYGITYCYANFEDRLLELESLVEVQNSGYEKLKSRAVNVENEVASLGANDPEKSGKHPLSDETEGDEDTEHTSPDLPDFTELISRRASSTTAAFQAHLSGIHCFNDHETVIFDVEDLDIDGVYGSGMYNLKDGIFEPRVSGVYAITWTVAAPSESQSFVTELMISGRMMGVITSDPDRGVHTDGTAEPTAQRSVVVGSGVHPSTAIVVVQVNAGDHCFIRMRHSSGTCRNVLSNNNVVRTSFSGWRLF
ncbi:uncharacterized protein LOC123539587 [Mercenaria mercenaria]|uniref:uncharacterized protein LOC123539587 n=1 Tax=Mercenaria mercenaria TaxID=6596 RepID=UPI00234EDE74|nr:uncharacterized protein LOC123539587 [Mercenaria mercenaria]